MPAQRGGVELSGVVAAVPVENQVVLGESLVDRLWIDESPLIADIANSADLLGRLLWVVVAPDGLLLAEVIPPAL